MQSPTFLQCTWRPCVAHLRVTGLRPYRLSRPGQSTCKIRDSNQHAGWSKLKLSSSNMAIYAMITTMCAIQMTVHRNRFNSNAVMWKSFVKPSRMWQALLQLYFMGDYPILLLLTHWPLGDFTEIFRKVIFQLILVIDGWSICSKIVLKWIAMDLTDCKSTLVQVMAWCRQASSPYLIQCWPRFMSPYGATRPQWVKNQMWPQYVTYYNMDIVLNNMYWMEWLTLEVLLDMTTTTTTTRTPACDLRYPPPPHDYPY